MGLKAIYRRPRTSKPAADHKIYPYLLGGLKITQPNQVWAADITYILMARGFLYRGSRRGAQEGQTRDIQHRPGQPIYQRVLYRALAAARSENQHGWEREL